MKLLDVDWLFLNDFWFCGGRIESFPMADEIRHLQIIE